MSRSISSTNPATYDSMADEIIRLARELDDEMVDPIYTLFDGVSAVGPSASAAHRKMLLHSFYTVAEYVSTARGSGAIDLYDLINGTPSDD